MLFVDLLQLWGAGGTSHQWDRLKWRVSGCQLPRGGRGADVGAGPREWEEGAGYSSWMETRPWWRSQRQRLTACSHPAKLSHSFTSGSQGSSGYICDLKKRLVCVLARGSVIISLLSMTSELQSIYDPEISVFNILKQPRNVKCYKLVSSGKENLFIL